MQRSTRQRAYFWMMGTCVVLVVLAWNVVRLWSTDLAVAMSVVAAVLPPAAALVANAGVRDRSTTPTGHPATQRRLWNG